MHTQILGNELSFETAELIRSQTFPFKNGFIDQVNISNTATEERQNFWLILNKQLTFNNSISL